MLESSGDPERLRDVRIRNAAGSALNPEMLTLVTEAMEEQPVTPGGEPWRLADLMAIDPQVKYDTVACRVTRLKLFRVLSALRTYLFEHKLDADEPMLRDPNALLRRLVRDMVIEPGELLDPWGHGLSFAHATGPRVPFLSTVPGFRLLSAGPDGRFGTGDDVVDPFQRVLASKTPYAKAVEEDRLVDAKWDMQVGDETVEAWKKTLEELTGTTFGEGGLGTVGTGGGGSGYGHSAGALGGRRSRGIDPGPARWLPPVRTDQRGHVRLSIPLGDAETTWQIVLVAMPDRGSLAATSVDVPISLPMSLKVNTGATWIAGDEVDVALDVRNRTEMAQTVSLQVLASGSAQLTDPKRNSQTLRVPGQSVATATVSVSGAWTGTGTLDVSLADGAAKIVDCVHHEWTIKPAGEVMAVSNAAVVERDTTVALPAAPTATPAVGSGRLVLERGLAPVLTAALESLTPERLHGQRSIADALEVFGRVRAWAIVRGGETDTLAVRARELSNQVVARRDLLRSKQPESDWEAPLLLRGQRWEIPTESPEQSHKTSKHKSQPSRRDNDCPPAKADSLVARFNWLDIAPRSEQGTERACWTALLASTIQQLAAVNDPLLLASAALSLQDWPAQAAVASALADRLAATVPVRKDGTLVLPVHLAADRAARSMIMTALVGGEKLRATGQSPKASTLRSRLLVERDASGGYGSPEATRLVVRALLDAEPAPSPAFVRWTEFSAKGLPTARGEVNLAANGSATLPLTAAAAGVRIETSSPSVLARAERSLFRAFSRPVDSSQSPLHFDLSMAKPLVADGAALMQVSLRHEFGHPVSVVVRIPLPPGASLADRVAGVRQVQGALYMRTSLDSDSLPRVSVIPLRFALSGTVTLPEATARIDDDEVALARTPARPLAITPRQ